MRLALEIKCSVRELEHRMEEREFLLWQRFDRRYGLPQRSLQLHLANIAMWTAHAAGATGMSLRDFLFDGRLHKKAEDTSATAADALGAIAGGVKVYKLNQGRKRG